jgi:hypothetical protein
MQRPISQKSAKLFKRILLYQCGIALGVVLIGSSPGGAAQTAKDIPATININTQANRAEIAGLPKDKKHVNSFSHKKHAEIYLKGKSAYSKNPYQDDFTCAACHPGSASRAEILAATPSARLGEALNKNGGPKKLKNYFHNICRACHKKLKKAKINSGPTNCKGCHGRQ